MDSHVIVAAADPETRSRLGVMLRQAGMLPLPFDSAEQAAEALVSAEAGMILLDLRLPGLDLQLLRLSLTPEAPATPLPLSEVERLHVEKVLDFTGGNRSRAARILGVSRSTLIEKIRRYQQR